MQKRKKKLTLLQRATRFVIKNGFAIVFYLLSVLFVYLMWETLLTVFE